MTWRGAALRLIMDEVHKRWPQSSGWEAQHEALCRTDVSVKETSVCIVDETGKICREVKLASYPEDLVQVLQDLPGT